MDENKFERDPAQADHQIRALSGTGFPPWTMWRTLKRLRSWEIDLPALGFTRQEALDRLNLEYPCHAIRFPPTCSLLLAADWLCPSTVCPPANDEMAQGDCKYSIVDMRRV